jgi:subtilisin family serine protease/subtilisin-like proprotein convertase family protein
MDDGFDLGHPEFNVPGKIVSPRDFGQDDSDPNPVYEDDNHGTACAGVAIAEENGTGVVGLAPGCAFMPVRTSSWLSDESIVSLFQYAIDKHADVISCSWSAASWNFPLSTKMHGIMHKAATEGRRNKKGCVILFAAGNENRPLNGQKDGKISHQGFALHPDVIAVGASNSMDQRSSYSNYGIELAICAPSSGSPGRRIVTTDRRGTKGYSTGDYTHDFGGTSSSTPLTAGLAALILSANPELTSAAVKGIIMDTADKIDQENGQYVNSHSPWYGHGRINAHQAVARAAGDSDERLPVVLFMEHQVNKPIPDLGVTEDEITFPLDVTIKEIEVVLDIKHTYRGDLRVILKPPQSGEIILHNGSGGSQKDLIRSFRSSDEPGLFGPVIGTPAKGNWYLKVMDMAKHDVGNLTKWGIAIAYA